MGKMQVKFDPRSKLCTIFFASYLLIFPATFSMEVIFVSFLCILLMLSGAWRKGLVFFAVFWVLVLADQWLYPHVTNGFLTFISFLLVGNRRMLPTIMAAAFAFQQTKISEWIAALKKCHLPDSLIIPLTVLFRFFPTLFQDYRSIRSAMKFRGIALSAWEMLLHPLETMEYIVVPVLMNGENASLDLSAAALVRGLSNPGVHTSIYQVKLKWQDIMLIIFLVVLVILGRAGVI